MAKAKEEQIFVQINDEIIELVGEDKSNFIAERSQMEANEKKRQDELDAQKALKLSVYTKLGLTEEEINAIL